MRHIDVEYWKDLCGYEKSHKISTRGKVVDKNTGEYLKIYRPTTYSNRFKVKIDKKPLDLTKLMVITFHKKPYSFYNIMKNNDYFEFYEDTFKINISDKPYNINILTDIYFDKCADVPINYININEVMIKERKPVKYKENGRCGNCDKKLYRGKYGDKYIWSKKSYKCKKCSGKGHKHTFTKLNEKRIIYKCCYCV